MMFNNDVISHLYTCFYLLKIPAKQLLDVETWRQLASFDLSKASIALVAKARVELVQVHDVRGGHQGEEEPPHGHRRLDLEAAEALNCPESPYTPLSRWLIERSGLYAVAPINIEVHL